jgi:hypothetical protein
MLKSGVITRSNAEWASPVVLVTKKDGSNRFGCDYRNLNSITKDISYPMPVIEEVIATLHGTTWFTSLDCRSSFWQLPLTKSAKDKSTLTTHIGKFKWEVVPFGLKGSPSTFMSFMNQVLEGLNKFTLVYMDDILIHTKKD